MPKGYCEDNEAGYEAKVGFTAEKSESEQG